MQLHVAAPNELRLLAVHKLPDRSRWRAVIDLLKGELAGASVHARHVF